ncbi:MAG: histidinol phosphate phosphatase [Polyangiaceae bacterium]|nr:histidinol phosphate phosphatase [Polyangiaceae bacterium]
MDPKELREILEFAVEAAQLAGTYTLGFFQADPPVELKADRSPVTAADRGAEERLRERILRAYPTHGILGEEHGEHVGSSKARWILDPIDGTYSFICGVPLYAVLVGFEWEGEMLAGVIHLPALRETVYAARGLGCFWNGRRAQVSSVDRVVDARVVYGGAAWLERCGRGPALSRLLGACHQDRGWCDAYGYALVATGRAEVSLDPVMNIWDTAALLPVLIEAGGELTDWSGQRTHRAPEALATNGRLHKEVLALLRGG